MKLKDIASLLNGEIVSGNSDIDITGVAGISDAKAGDVTFLSSKKYQKDLANCKAACVLVQQPLVDVSITQLKVANPYLICETA